MSPSPTAMSCRREEKWPEISDLKAHPEGARGRCRGYPRNERHFNKRPICRRSIATLEFGPVVPKDPLFERSLCESMIATAGLTPLLLAHRHVT